MEPKNKSKSFCFWGEVTSVGMRVSNTGSAVDLEGKPKKIEVFNS